MKDIKYFRISKYVLEPVGAYVYTYANIYIVPFMHTCISTSFLHVIQMGDYITDHITYPQDS